MTYGQSFYKPMLEVFDYLKDNGFTYYTMNQKEDLLRTDELIIKNLKTNKVLQISQEIGKVPVLSFGNSGGDAAMHNYALGNKQYKTAAFMLIADDDARDHANRGLAVDINTLYNPYYKDRADGTRYIQPATGEPYCDRSWDFPYKITHDDLCFKLFTEAGFEWGGDWTTCKDFQHFEIIE